MTEEAVTEDMPEFPWEMNYLWTWFKEISMGLTISGFGYPTITWETLESWCRLTRRDLERWEVVTLVQLGALRAGAHGKKGASKTAEDDRNSDAAARNRAPTRRLTHTTPAIQKPQVRRR